MATVEELKNRARELEIDGFSSMNKAELEEAVAAEEAGFDDDDQAIEQVVGGAVDEDGVPLDAQIQQELEVQRQQENVSSTFEPQDNGDHAAKGVNAQQQTYVSNVGNDGALNRLQSPVTRRSAGVKSINTMDDGTIVVGIEG